MEKAKKDRNNANIYSVIDKHYRKKSQREAVEAILIFYDGRGNMST